MREFGLNCLEKTKRDSYNCLQIFKEIYIYIYIKGSDSFIFNFREKPKIQANEFIWEVRQTMLKGLEVLSDRMGGIVSSESL